MDEVSKREIRAKRLVAAVLLAISVQMWSAPPLWAAEASVQTETSAAGEAKETKETKNAKATDSETGGEADADEGENVVVPVIGYSTRSAAGSDYGVIPLADAADPNPNFGGELAWYTDDDGKTQWKTNGKGELTGVTSINGAVLQMDVNDDEFMTAIGVKSYANSYGSAFGWYARAEGQYSVAVGYAAETDGTGVALGYNAKAKADGGTSLGMAAEVGEEHTNSVAIGSYSVTNAANQVSFGHKTGDNDVESGLTYKTDLFRSLTNISDIDMAGNINLGGGLDWYNDENGKTHWKSNGKGELTGVSSINGVIFHMDVNDDEFVTAIGVDSDARVYGTAFGWSARAEGAYGTAVGYAAEVADDWGVAVGYTAVVKKMAGTALGANALVSHYNSVAIGTDSATTAENQVAFGSRSLAGISDIDMAGNISLGGEWSWNDAGTSYKSNGLGNLTGVIGINGIEFLNYDCGDGPVLAIGSTIGNDSTANSVGLGINTIIEGYGSVAIGVNTNVRGNDATGVGSGAAVDGENSVAVGSNAFAIADGATAVGSASRVYAEGGSALGYGTSVAAAHTNSVAIGAKSATGAANQVSFGHKVGDRNEYGGSNFTDDLFRSLVNVADIEMHGALTGVTGIDGVTVSGTDASTGLTVGGNAVIGKTDTPFSSTGFAVAKDGAVTAKTVNGATITGTGFNGVTLEKGADSHYKVGGVDVTKMQTDVAGKADAATVTALDTRVGKSETDIGTLKATVGDSSKGLVKDTADLKAAVGDSSKGLVKQVSDVDTAYKAADTVLQGRAKTLEDKTAGISRSGSTTILETNTSVSSSGITTNKATVSGATATTLENGKLTVGAATVQNTGFAVGSSSLNNGSLTIDGNNKLTTAGLTASKVTVGTVTVSGGKVSGLTDAALSAVSTEAVTGKQLNATNTTVSALDTAYKAADTQIRTDFAAADTTLQNNIDAKVAQTAYDTKMSALDSADNALSGRATALETKTAKFNTAGDNLTGMANITSTAATLGGVGFASAGVMTGVASIDGIAIDASRNLSNAGTYNGVTVAAAGISGTSVFNGAAITNNSFNGVTLEKGADNHYKVGGVDVSALKTTVDSISADGVGTADTAGIKRDTTGTATTTIETNTAISSSGITTNKATVSGATATTLENGKLTVGAATVQNTGFAVGSSSLNNGSLTVDGNNKLTTAGLTASKVTVGTVTVSGVKPFRLMVIQN